ncbi:MAG: hypothetical protein WC875_05950 [Candidatus Absconditabacterales bacterium]|jgi:hypothetical protein
MSDDIKSNYMSDSMSDSMQYQSFTYDIAGHVIELVWKLPDAQNWQLPGFAPFLSKKLSDAVNDAQTQNSYKDKLLSVNIKSIEEVDEANESAKDSVHKYSEQTILQEQAISQVRKITTFEIENGTCELSKQDNSYEFLIFSIDGKLSVKLEMEKGDSTMNCHCVSYEKLCSSESNSNSNSNSNLTRPIMVPDPHHLRFAIWMAGGFAGIPKWTSAIHASVIIYENQAVLFLGESGTGKSTHTQLWLENIPGTRLLNDDSPILRLHKQNENPDGASGGYPNGASDGNSNGRQENTISIYGSPWSGKGNVYLNENYPVAAVVRLQQAPYNRSTRLNVVQGFAALYPSFPPAYLKDEDLHQEICTIISEILKTVPVFRLECLPKPSAAMHMYQKIFTHEEKTPD